MRQVSVHGWSNKLLRRLGLVATAATSACSATPAASSGSTLKGSFNFYSGGDVNIEQLWTKDIIPAFEKQYPGVTVHYVFSSHGKNDTTALDTVGVAVKAIGSSTQSARRTW